jgi:hypothetical protein
MFSENAVSLSNNGLVGREPTRGHGIQTGVKRQKTELMRFGWMEENKGINTAWGGNEHYKSKRRWQGKNEDKKNSLYIIMFEIIIC